MLQVGEDRQIRALVEGVAAVIKRKAVGENLPVNLVAGNRDGTIGIGVGSPVVTEVICIHLHISIEQIDVLSSCRIEGNVTSGNTCPGTTGIKGAGVQAYRTCSGFTVTNEDSSGGGCDI